MVLPIHVMNQCKKSCMNFGLNSYTLNSNVNSYINLYLLNKYMNLYMNS